MSDYSDLPEGGLPPGRMRRPPLGLERDRMQGLLRHLSGEWPDAPAQVLVVPARRREWDGLARAIAGGGSPDGGGPLVRVMYDQVTDWLERSSALASATPVNELIHAAAEHVVAEHQTTAATARAELERQRRLAAELEPLLESEAWRPPRVSDFDLDDAERVRLTRLRELQLRGRERERYEALADHLLREQVAVPETVLLAPVRARELRGLAWALIYPAAPDQADRPTRLAYDLLQELLARGRDLASYRAPGQALEKARCEQIIAQHQDGLQAARCFLSLTA